MKALFVMLILIVTVRFFLYAARKFLDNWDNTQEKKRLRKEKQEQNRKKQQQNKERRQQTTQAALFYIKHQDFLNKMAAEVIKARKKGRLVRITLLLGEMQIEYPRISKQNTLCVCYHDFGHPVLSRADAVMTADVLARLLALKYDAPAVARGNLIVFHAVPQKQDAPEKKTSLKNKLPALVKSKKKP